MATSCDSIRERRWSLATRWQALAKLYIDWIKCSLKETREAPVFTIGCRPLSLFDRYCSSYRSLHSRPLRPGVLLIRPCDRKKNPPPSSTPESNASAQFRRQPARGPCNSYRPRCKRTSQYALEKGIASNYVFVVAKLVYGYVILMFMDLACCTRITYVCNVSIVERNCDTR